MVTKFTWRPRGPRFQPQLGQKSGCMFHFELGLGVLNPGLDTIGCTPRTCFPQFIVITYSRMKNRV